MSTNLNGPGGQRLKEVGWVGVVHHGQIDPGLLQPALEAEHIILVLKWAAQAKFLRQPLEARRLTEGGERKRQGE